MKVRELWSFRDQAVTRIDLAGFDLHAVDGPIGTVAQSIEASGGGYLIVNPGVGMPLGRQLLVPAGLVDKVDVDNRRVSVKAEREQIRNAPEFAGSEVLDESARIGMDEYFGSLMGEGAGRARRRRGATTARARNSQPPRGTRTRSRRAAEGPTKAELYEQAKRLGIQGRSKMSKPQLARAVSRRRGRSSGGGSSRAKASPFDVQAFLEGVGYPARKQRLLREAESQGADRKVRTTLRRLPDKSFDSPTEVSEAIGRLG
jgi:Protein of unknown function (DUF2795)